MDLWTQSDLCTPWCVHVAATLRIADHIQAGKSEINALASAAGAHPDSLHRVMRHLVSKGVFLEPAPSHFALNDTAQAFLEPPFRLGLDLDSFGGRMAGAWGTLLSTVRTGLPAYHEAFGRPFWDDLDANPNISASFDALMGPGHGVPDTQILADAKGWENISTVVDVGGGTGSFLAEVLRLNPHVRGILLDLTRTIARSTDVLSAAGVADRVTTAGQSFFEPLPAGADLYILKSVLSDWPDHKAVAILKRCAEAARPSGRVMVFTNAGPGEEASPELLMMVLMGGRARSFEDLSEMARQAGLEVTAYKRQASGRVILECRPLAR